jgi:hypothetical protein
MNKGYQVVEPLLVDKLAAKPATFEFAVATFYWLIKELYAEFPERLKEEIVEIIPVTYYQSYPAIGIACKDVESDPDISNFVEKTMDRLLRERPVCELLDSVANSGLSWKDLTHRLMVDGESLRVQ